ncbi:MAG: hypothetical protein KF730_15740 [Sphingomonas sp.]|uniref:hypothetical protein n=1 Tax=Sphingomonas sp. TaxID=28214 RepID=UPI0025DBE269|nr:hypothetical protein [Sphingomonas sp.]MBX3566018.1 hypothetical protein [Sphingomonas sp.]
MLTPLAAQGDWREASTPHFVIYSQQSVERLREFATHLERFDKGMRVLRGLHDEPVGPSARVTVYVVDDSDDVAALIGDRMVAGFYSPRAGNSLAVIPRTTGDSSDIALKPLAILLHEYGHHFMSAMWPNSALPAWFIEGFAEFHATALFNKDGGITFGEAPLYRGVGLMRGNLLPIDKLLVADGFKLKGEQRDALYGRGWLLTHYLMIGQPARAGQLGKYVAAINAGTEPMTAATAAFGDLRALDRELERYKLGKFAINRLPGPLAIGDVSIRELGAGEAAMMKVRIRSKAGVGAKEAAAVYADARKAAEPYPNDAAAQIVLAGAALDAGDFAGGEAAASRAIAADPKAMDGYLFKAQAQSLAARKSGDRDKARWAAIRQTIIAANRLDPDNPRPLIRYYLSFGDAREAPSQAARNGLVRALELAPQDRGLRFLGAALYLREGQAPSARVLLAPLAFQPHSPALAERAQKLITLIDAGKAETALAELQGKPADDTDTPDAK